MSVRQSLLAILDQGPCYGYQLRAEFDRRTGSTWPLNVGQIYNTLERLERDGLVAKGEVDAQGHIYYEITAAGSAAVRDWLDSPVERAGATRDELAMKIAIAVTLPNSNPAAILAEQLRAATAECEEARSAARGPVTGGESLAAAIIYDARIAHAEAQITWLEGIAVRLSQHPEELRRLPLAEERPRRGRPSAAA